MCGSECECLQWPPVEDSNGFRTASCRLPYSSSTSVFSRILTETGTNATFTAKRNKFISAEPAAKLVDVNCPCNCTYVSHMCCGSNGTVWEAPGKYVQYA